MSQFAFHSEVMKKSKTKEEKKYKDLN